MKLKFKIALVLLAIYMIAGNICYWRLDLDHMFRYKTGVECGTVTEDFTELQNIKHGTRTEYYLKVQYPTREKIENVTAETFYENHRVGSQVCFNRYEGVSLWLVGVVFGDIILAIIAFVWVMMKFLDWDDN